MEEAQDSAMESIIQKPLAEDARWDVLPMTPERFDDFSAVVNPTGREKHCWCLSHRLGAKDIQTLGTGNRVDAMRSLSAEPIAPGVVAYKEGVPVGWCSISPRAQIPLLERSKLIRPVDGLAVWSIICVVVRSGFRRQGVTTHMLEGALDYAKELGAPAVEAYPVDPEGRMDLTMAFVGTRKMFESVGFEVIGVTDAVASRMPRLVMRKTF